MRPYLHICGVYVRELWAVKWYHAIFKLISALTIHIHTAHNKFKMPTETKVLFVCLRLLNMQQNEHMLTQFGRTAQRTLQFCAFKFIKLTQNTTACTSETLVPPIYRTFNEVCGMYRVPTLLLLLLLKKLQKFCKCLKNELIGRSLSFFVYIGVN